MDVKTTKTTESQGERLKKRSNVGEIWHRLRKNKLSMICLAVLVIMILGIIFAGVLSPYDYAAQDLTQRFALPSKEHWMGCDDYGRDLLTRLLVGGRYSLLDCHFVRCHWHYLRHGHWRTLRLLRKAH